MEISELQVLGEWRMTVIEICQNPIINLFHWNGFFDLEMSRRSRERGKMQKK